MNQPLSDDDVLKICEDKSNLLTYSDLMKYDKIEDILEYNSCIILYENGESDIGHWCCVFVNSKGNYEFFDPYGLGPDEELKPMKSKIKHTWLRRMLYNCKKKVEYNEHALQKLKEGVNTCGRWCGMRIYLRDIPLDIFAKLFDDESITLLTSDIVQFPLE